MKDFEERLDAISSRLLIRYDSTPNALNENSHFFCMESATIETKQAFKTALQNHISAKLSTCEVGKSIVYSFHFGKTISNSPPLKGTFTSSFNANMEEVLAEIPQLPANQFYMLPGSVTLRIKLVGVTANGPEIKVYFNYDWLE